MSEKRYTQITVPDREVRNYLPDGWRVVERYRDDDGLKAVLRRLIPAGSGCVEAVC